MLEPGACAGIRDTRSCFFQPAPATPTSTTTNPEPARPRGVPPHEVIPPHQTVVSSAPCSCFPKFSRRFLLHMIKIGFHQHFLLQYSTTEKMSPVKRSPSQQTLNPGTYLCSVCILVWHGVSVCMYFWVCLSFPCRETDVPVIMQCVLVTLVLDLTFMYLHPVMMSTDTLAGTATAAWSVYGPLRLRVDYNTTRILVQLVQPAPMLTFNLVPTLYAVLSQ